MKLIEDYVALDHCQFVAGLDLSVSDLVHNGSHQEQAISAGIVTLPRWAKVSRLCQGWVELVLQRAPQ